MLVYQVEVALIIKQILQIGAVEKLQRPVMRIGILIARFQAFTLTLGGVPWIRGGVPVIVVDTPTTGDDDVVMMVGDAVP